jgi:hypothetical protein
MKSATSMRSGVLAVTLAAAGFGVGGEAARADLITLDVSATFSPPSSDGVCRQTCTLAGDIMIDNSSGATNNGFVSADVTATGFSTGLGPLILDPFTEFAGVGSFAVPPANTDLNLASSPDPIRPFAFLTLAFEAPTAGSFVGYVGGPLSGGTITTRASLPFTLISGSLTPTASTAVPEPPSLLLLLSALGGCGTILFWGRRPQNRATWVNSSVTSSSRNIR